MRSFEDSDSQLFGACPPSLERSYCSLPYGLSAAGGFGGLSGSGCLLPRYESTCANCSVLAARAVAGNSNRSAALAAGSGATVGWPSESERGEGEEEAFVGTECCFAASFRGEGLSLSTHWPCEPRLVFIWSSSACSHL